MRYVPHIDELNSVQKLPETERLFYFAQKISELEEVWGLGDETGWVTDQVDDVCALPIWPFKEFALQNARDKWAHLEPQAVSLDHFLDRVIKLAVREDIMLDVLPVDRQPGVVVTPAQFYDYMDGLIDAGEYYMEG